MSKPMSTDLSNAIEIAASFHNQWVEDFGLHTGDPGPLDKLIDELELAIVVAKRKKREAEEENE